MVRPPQVICAVAAPRMWPARRRYNEAPQGSSTDWCHGTVAKYGMVFSASSSVYSASAGACLE